ncbi:MAG: hypothetical protein J0I11_00660 [Actinobacteria bacterium]|nr:hypothetical protein [Actinomycetota bacterium]
MTTTETPAAAVLARLDEARDLVLRFAELGVVPTRIETNDEVLEEPRNFAEGDVRFSFYGRGEECERAAVALLSAYPAAVIERDHQRDSFTMYCAGRPSWGAYFSNSVCTRVQTGTRTKTVPDPVAMEQVPLIEVEEPVYEWRCADPLADMAATK